MRGGTTTRGQSFSSFRGSIKPSGKSRPYRSQAPSWNQSRPSFDQNLNQSLSQPEQTSSTYFGAFDPSNEKTNKSYSQTKRSTQYQENPNEYDGFYPKRVRGYNDEVDNSQTYYSSETNYYSPTTTSTFPDYPSNSNTYSSQSTSYNNPPASIPPPPWQNHPEPHYNQQQYLNPGSSYTNQMSMLKILY
jgi:hypothetical protein